ncbi:MAG: peptidylprolyl isomerase [Bermanella sp.]
MKSIIKINIFKHFSFALFLFTSIESQATITSTLQDEASYASVNDWAIPTKSVELLYQYSAAKNSDLTKSQLVKSIIENHLLANYAEQTIGLSKISDETKVGFKQKYATQEQLINVLKYKYQENISQSIHQLEGGNLNSVIVTPITISKAMLSKLFIMNKAMEYKINSKQQNTFKITSLLNYQFPQGKQQSITLWDIYDRTNMQEKIALFKADTHTLKKLTHRYLSSLYVSYWVKQFTEVSDTELNSLKQFIAENRIGHQVHLYKGSKTTVHHSNQTLRTLSKQVSPQEIEQYFLSHKEEFKTVQKVKARHIQLTSQIQADQVYQELKSGLNFNKAIKKYSQAADKNNRIPGGLGWIIRKDIKGNWLRTLPFTQKQVATFSAPFMSPKKNYENPVWEIIYLDERVLGYLLPTSKTVQYNASKAIAKKRINQSVNETKNQIWKKARVNLNKKKISLDVFNQQTTDLTLFSKSHQHGENGHEH